MVKRSLRYRKTSASRASSPRLYSYKKNVTSVAESQEPRSEQLSMNMYNVRKKIALLQQKIEENFKQRIQTKEIIDKNKREISWIQKKSVNYQDRLWKIKRDMEISRDKIQLIKRYKWRVQKQLMMKQDQRLAIQNNLIQELQAEEYANAKTKQMKQKNLIQEQNKLNQNLEKEDNKLQREIKFIQKQLVYKQFHDSDKSVQERYKKRLQQFRTQIDQQISSFKQRNNQQYQRLVGQQITIIKQHVKFLKQLMQSLKNRLINAKIYLDKKQVRQNHQEQFQAQMKLNDIKRHQYQLRQLHKRYQDQIQRYTRNFNSKNEERQNLRKRFGIEINFQQEKSHKIQFQKELLNFRDQYHLLEKDQMKKFQQFKNAQDKSKKQQKNTYQLDKQKDLQKIKKIKNDLVKFEKQKFSLEELIIKLQNGPEDQNVFNQIGNCLESGCYYQKFIQGYKTYKYIQSLEDPQNDLNKKLKGFQQIFEDYKYFRSNLLKRFQYQKRQINQFYQSSKNRYNKIHQEKMARLKNCFQQTDLLKSTFYSEQDQTSEEQRLDYLKKVLKPIQEQYSRLKQLISQANRLQECCKRLEHQFRQYSFYKRTYNIKRIDLLFRQLKNQRKIKQKRSRIFSRQQQWNWQNM